MAQVIEKCFILSIFGLIPEPQIQAAAGALVSVVATDTYKLAVGKGGTRSLFSRRMDGSETCLVPVHLWFNTFPVLLSYFQ